MNAARVAWRPGAGNGRLAVLAAARGGAALLGLATVLVVARALSPEDLGRWSIALAVQGYALHLGEFGLRSVATTEAARAGCRLPELLARYLRLRLMLTAVALAAVAAGCALWRPSDLPLVILVTLSVLPVALQLDWLALVDDRVGLAALLLLVRPVVFLALLGLWPGRVSIFDLASCFLAAWALAAATSWLALRRPACGPHGPVPTAALMLRRGGRLAAITLTNQLQLTADLIAVGWVVGVARAGDYWLAGQVLVAGLLFANAAGQMALARLPALADDPDRFGDAVRTEVARTLWFALSCAAVAGFAAPLLLPVLFGAEHAQSVTVLLWLLPWFVLQHPTTVLQAALTAAGREASVLRANALAVAVLLAALGAAATTSSLVAFALARSLAEATRLGVLLVSFAPPLRWLPLRGGQTSTTA